MHGRLSERLEASRGALLVELGEGSGFKFEELHELRRGDFQTFRCGGNFPIIIVQGVEGFREQGGKEVMMGIDCDALLAEAGFPIGRGLRHGAGGANVEGELSPQAVDRLMVVFSAGASFGSLGGDAGWFVVENDSAFDLVAVLPSRTRPADVARGTVVEQTFDGQTGGVWHGHAVFARREITRERGDLLFKRAPLFYSGESSFRPQSPLAHRIPWIDFLAGNAAY